MPESTRSGIAELVYNQFKQEILETAPHPVAAGKLAQARPDKDAIRQGDLETWAPFLYGRSKVQRNLKYQLGLCDECSEIERSCHKGGRCRI